jgi:hypothetical protein
MKVWGGRNYLSLPFHLAGADYQMMLNLKFVTQLFNNVDSIPITATCTGNLSPTEVDNSPLMMMRHGYAIINNNANKYTVQSCRQKNSY